MHDTKNQIETSLAQTIIERDKYVAYLKKIKKNICISKFNLAAIDIEEETYSQREKINIKKQIDSIFFSLITLYQSL